MDLQSAREKMARDQVGVTRISRPLAAVLTALFVLGIALVPLTQCAQETREFVTGRREAWMPRAWEIFRALPRAWGALSNADGPVFSRILAANRILMREMARYEDDLEDESLLGKAVRPRMQILLNALGVGNEQAYAGVNGWLFYRPGIDYLTGPGFLDSRALARKAASGDEWLPAPRPDPRPALAELHRALAGRGIALVVMPTPIKPMIHPEMFFRGMDPDGLPQNSSYARFVRELKEQGIQVFEPAPALVRAKAATRQPQYLATDTHWRPEAVRLSASLLAQELTRMGILSPSAGPIFTSVQTTATNTGDIAAMLQLPAWQQQYPPEQVLPRQVLGSDREPWRPDPGAEILVLGDSFSNIYSLEVMGWGEAAGFVEHLALELQRPVDRITRNDDGAFATREILSRELARGHDRLAGKRVVVFQFAVRELAVGDWKVLDMTLGDPLPPRFFVPGPGETRTVRGVVASTSRVPRPGSVPYADHVMALHLVDLEEDDTPLDDPQAVVYVWGMRDNVWTSAARLRPGDEVGIRLRAWAEVANLYDGINRSELDDFALQLEEPTWGEVNR